MLRQIRALIKELDKFISNGYLVVDFNLDTRIKAICANWIQKKELTTYAPLKGKEYDCYLVPKRDIEKLLASPPMKIKRFDG